MEATLENLDTSYGSDRNGLIWGYAFEPGGVPWTIGSEDAALWLREHQSAPGSFLWLHFSLANAASEPWLRSTFTLPDSFYDSLNDTVVSTRLEQDGNTLVAVLHDVAFDFKFDPESVSTVHLSVTSSFLVTARLRPVRSVDRLRAAVSSGQPFRSPAELLAELLRYQADVLTEIVRDSGRHVDVIEDKLLANRIATSRRELGLLRRTLVRLQRLLAPEPAAMFRILGRSPAWIGLEDLQELRQSAEEFSAATADTGVLVERVKLLQEELAAQVGEHTSRTLFVLTVVTVLALPINLVAGLFGMNVGGIPFAEHRIGFTLIVVALGLFTVAAAYMALGRSRES